MSGAGFSWARCAEHVAGARTICGFGRVAQVIGLVIEGRRPGLRHRGPLPHQAGGGEPGRPGRGGGVQGSQDPAHSPTERCGAWGPGRGSSPSDGPTRCGSERPSSAGVVDGLGEPIDGKGPLMTEEVYPLYAEPSHPLQRQRISEPVDVGVRTINALLVFGKGAAE